MPFSPWLCVNLDNKSLIDGYSWNNFFAIIIWSLWKARNEFLFQDKKAKPDSVVVQGRVWARMSHESAMRSMMNHMRAVRMVSVGKKSDLTIIH